MKNTILGGQNVIAAGSGFTQIAPQLDFKNDIDALLAHLESLGVPSDEAEGLREAVLADKDAGAPGPLGEETRTWLGSFTASAASGGLVAALQNMPQIVEALRTFLPSFMAPVLADYG